MLHIIWNIFLYICVIAVIYNNTRYIFKNKSLQKIINQLKETLNKKFTDSFADPQLREMRIMLPKELEEIKNSALTEYHNSPNGPHYECHKTLLIVLYTLYSKNNS